MGTFMHGQSVVKSVVLVGLDLTPSSADVLGAAANLGRMSPIELHVAHVLPLPPAESLGVVHADREVRFANLVDSATTHLRRLVTEAAPPSERVFLHIRSGVSDVEIAQLASDVAADLLVVGTHGRTGLERLILGSVAESVVRHAPCPVLVYRPKAVHTWEQIAPPCPDCLATQRETQRAKLWCERHSQHHPRAHTYSEIPASYGIGSQTFR
jgi:nucleotide-binding universal stress UspA family protein